MVVLQVSIITSNNLSLSSFTICAVICNVDGWTDIELFGTSKCKWFKNMAGTRNTYLKF